MDHDGYGYSGSLRQQFRHRQRRRGPQGRDPGGGEGNRPAEDALLRHVVRRRSAPAPTRRSSRSASTGWCWPPSPTRARSPPRSDRRRKRIEELRANPRRKRDAAMIRSIFTRDGHAEAYDPALPEAIVAAEMKFGDTIPSGTYLDMAVNLPLVDPTKVQVAGADDARRARRQLDQRRPARLLPATAERRPPVRHPAAHRAQPGLQQEPAPAVVRGEELPRRAGAGCDVKRA